jgi:rfaE bifunctional protein nucleotidyltransferase chain/domain
MLQSKIKTLKELAIQRKEWQSSNQKVIFTNGCFDLIHKGHLFYLEQAKALGDKLIVAINSDASVKQLKGEERPIKPQDDRMLTMAAFSFVDAVVLFEEETPKNVIEALIPDVLVKGGDYIIEDIVGYSTVIQNGGEVLTLPFVDGNSTSNFVKKIKK